MSRDGVWAEPKNAFKIDDTCILQPSHPLTTEIRTSLSVSDANKVGWGQSACVWFYEPTSAERFNRDQHVNHLKTSLCHTLNAYRPWCGRLLMRPYQKDPVTQQIRHYGFLELLNGLDDPGVLFIEASYPGKLDETVPTLDQRRSTHTRWNATHLDSMAWFPEQAVANPLAKFDPSSSTEHCVIIKLTIFEDGAMAVAIKVSHACADAHSLVHFANDWSSVCRAQLNQTLRPSVRPHFDSRLVDGIAGDISAPDPNPVVIAAAKALPVQRFDSWISLPDQIPPEFTEDPTSTVAAGDLMPLAEMDMKCPKSHYILHFSQQQVWTLWNNARGGSKLSVSRQDALVAHVWSRINTARGLAEDDNPVYCNYMLGFRRRMWPQLSDLFVGSPFAVVSAEGRASETCAPEKLDMTASLIASTTRRFTNETIGSLLHLWAYESSPTRIWGHMFGHRHLMVTSWVREGVNHVDFGLGSLRFSRMNMPSIDGLLLLVEATGTSTESTTDLGKPWDRLGVDVSVWLAEDIMKKMLQDPLLLP